MRKKKKMLLCTLVFCCILSACGQKKEEKPEKPHPAAEAPEKEKDKDADKKEKGEKDTDKTEKKKTEEKQEVKTAPKVEKTEAERLIQDQTFDTELTPLGNVRFASYAPDTTQSPYGDAEFKLLQNQQVITVLSGMNQSNTRKEETFHKVEAVSFRDYNQDGYTDIIIICSYIPDDRTKSVYSEARLYFGSAEGSFTLDVDRSSCIILDSAWETLSSSPLFTVLYRLYVYGTEISVLPNTSGVLLVDRVSPVATVFSLAMAPISPAWSSGTSMGLEPSSTYSLFNFSSESFVALYKVSSPLITPEQTLTREYLPKNGSTMVLNTYADLALAKS